MGSKEDRWRDSGFTLIELMIVVTIIGILAAIAVPKFAQVARKSNEGACKGALGGIRSALMIYFSDMEGQFPDDMNSLTISGKYLASIPLARTPYYHADTSTANNTSGSAGPSDCGNGGGMYDQGGWCYKNYNLLLDWGGVYVNCIHTDTTSSVWSSY